MKLLGDLSKEAAWVLVRTSQQLRQYIGLETDPTVQVTVQLMIDEVSAELASRNAAVLAERAAKESSC